MIDGIKITWSNQFFAKGNCFWKTKWWQMVTIIRRQHGCEDRLTYQWESWSFLLFVRLQMIAILLMVFESYKRWYFEGYRNNLDNFRNVKTYEFQSFQPNFYLKIIFIAGADLFWSVDLWLREYLHLSSSLVLILYVLLRQFHLLLVHSSKVFYSIIFVHI